MSNTRTRNVDQEVARLGGLLGPLTRDGAPPEVIEKTRQELDRAKRLAAIKAAVKNPPPLTPEVFSSVVAALAGAVVTDA